MRKLWILAVAALLVVAIAAPSFAAETTITGSYRIRGVSEWNWDKNHKGDVPAGAPYTFAKGDDLYTGYFDQRFRLTITHTRSEFLKAVVSVDLVEDMWGQQRNFTSNNNWIGANKTSTDGYINTAYIQAITKIGLFKFGTDGTSRFGMGTWSDSGLRGNGTTNPGVTWGMKIDNFIATVTYVKYVDFVDYVLDGVAGFPAGTVKVWPGGPYDTIGGPNSNFKNVDTDTYVITAHYITDNYKVGGLYQLIRDPAAVGASFLVGGVADLFKFSGEAMGYGAFGSRWPTPLAAPFGFGRAGMYDAWLHVAALYADLKFLDGKLEVKGEYDRIWGKGTLNGRGDSFNAYLAAVPLPANYRLRDLKVDGHTVYVDVSYDLDIAKVGMAFLYGSGETHWRPYSQSHFNFNTTGNDDFHWGNVVLPGDQQLLGDPYAPLGLGNNPENLTSVKLYFSVDPIESLDIHGAVIWSQYTQPVGRYADFNLAPGGQAFYGHPMNYLNPTGSVMDYVPAHASHGLGWELDLGFTYQIMEGLSLNSEFGVLFTGDAFDYMTGTLGVPATYAEHNWGAIYRWVNTLTYEF
jgi:hypothetical protein